MNESVVTWIVIVLGFVIGGGVALFLKKRKTK